MLEELRVGASCTKEPGGAWGRKAGAGTDRQTDRLAAGSLQGYCKRSGDAPEGRELRSGPFLSVLVLGSGSCRAGEPLPRLVQLQGAIGGAPLSPLPQLRLASSLCQHTLHIFFLSSSLLFARTDLFITACILFLLIHPCMLAVLLLLLLVGTAQLGPQCHGLAPPPPRAGFAFSASTLLEGPPSPSLSAGDEEQLIIFFTKSKVQRPELVPHCHQYPELYREQFLLRDA